MAKKVRNVSKLKTKTSLQKIRSQSPNVKKISRPQQRRKLLSLVGKTEGVSLGDYTLGLMKLG